MGEPRRRGGKSRQERRLLQAGRPRRARRPFRLSLQRARPRANSGHDGAERKRAGSGSTARLHRTSRGAGARARLRQANGRACGLKGDHVTVDAPTKVEDVLETARAESTHADRLVIFGITGDLAKVMTFRSLYRLEQRGLLDCPIVGVAVDDWTVDQLSERARTSIAGTGEEIDEDVFKRFASRLSYVSGDFGDDATYGRVAAALKGATL